ncbi:MAG: thiamine pyrophosphate-requiring protein [Candidatus Bathyarchaeia archaeon]
MSSRSLLKGSSPPVKTFKEEYNERGAKQIPVENLAQAFVEIAVRCGIKYWFVNTGTDWPPIMDAVARAWAKGLEWPKFIVCPHEFTATSMAHGYAMVSGDVPLVGYHLTVGTYNALGAIANAYTAHMPLFLFAGSGWITREPPTGGRGPYAQGSRYQAGPLREYIKWDCEIKLKEHIPHIMQRALQIARTEPSGPVYVTVPNEIALLKVDGVELPPIELCEPPASPPGDSKAIAQAAKLLVEAEKPLIITSALGRNPAAVDQLVRFAELLAIPVSGALGVFGYMNFPTNHPLHVSIPLQEADVIFIIENPRPWTGKYVPNPNAKYINLAIDPLYIKAYPLTGFCPSHVSIIADPVKALIQLHRAASRLISKSPNEKEEINERFERIKEIHNAQVNALKRDALSVRNKKPIDRRWVNYCIGQIKTEKDVLISDYGYAYQGSGDFTVPGTYFANPPSACLGWGLGAALGAKLAAPDRTVIVCMGDGSYMYGNPTVAHFTSKKYGLPFLTVVYNNQGWGAPRRLLMEEYPDGWAMRHGYVKTLNSFEPSPDFKLVCEASGGYAETVEDPSEVQPALKRALKAVKVEKRQALLNFILAFGE